LPGAGHAFLAALDGDLIGLGSILLGHIDLDAILVLEPLDVLALCANNGSVVLPGNSKELDSLVCHFLDLGKNPFLGLFGVPLATSDLDDTLGRRCTLLLPNRMLDLLRVFDVDFHIELVAVLLNTCTARANNTGDEIAGNGELKALLDSVLVPMPVVEPKEERTKPLSISSVLASSTTSLISLTALATSTGEPRTVTVSLGPSWIAKALPSPMILLPPVSIQQSTHIEGDPRVESRIVLAFDSIVPFLFDGQCLDLDLSKRLDNGQDL
jgi:hypothetical protein